MMALIGLAAFLLGCLMCFLLGHKLGAERSDTAAAQYIATKAELNRVRELNKELNNTLEMHRELVRLAAPILEEHTWHSLGLNK